MPLRKLSLARKGSSGDVRDKGRENGKRNKDRPPSAWYPGGTTGADSNAVATPMACGPDKPVDAVPPSTKTSTATSSPAPSTRQSSHPPSKQSSVNGGSTPTGDDEHPPARKRKQSLAAKSKRRLSAIFGGSPAHSQMPNLDRASPAPSETPTTAASQSAVPSSVSTPQTESMAKYAALDTKGAPPTVLPNGTLTSSPPVASPTDSLGANVTALSLDTSAKDVPNGTAAHADPVTPTAPAFVASPIAESPGEDLFPPRPIGMNGSTPGASSGASTPTCMRSLYSQWGLDDVSSDEEDDDGYATPSEGLSEVAEEDEEAENNSGSAAAGVARAAGATGAAGVAGGSGPRLTRTHAGRAKVERPVFKRGDPKTVDQAAVLDQDLALCRQVLGMFLSSKMKEAEDMLHKADPQSTHMYLQSGQSVIQSLKGLMTFDPVDLETALDIAKATTATATELRRPTSWAATLRSGASQQRIRSMSKLERHAELVYAETLLVKAILGIVGGGDWMGLIREAFNMRTAHGIYRTLQLFLEERDKNGFDTSIDNDFRSGVLLGTGTSSLMLSLLPSKVLKVAEVFGYGGDRNVALKTLMAAGGWTTDSATPELDETNEGVRRPICDMILLTFHLVISVLMPVSGVDIKAARRILAYNIRRYPDGIFFLYFQARLHTNECEPERSNASLQRALDLDLEYVQLQHMCLWDFGCNFFQLNDWNGARQCFDILRRESNWSRAVYTYSAAVNVIELVDDPTVPEATEALAVELVTSLPKLTKKIAGKSLPIEKLVSGKGRKYVQQGNRLFMPAMELAYVFGALGFTPRRLLVSRWLPRINADLAKLEASSPEEWGNGEGYWDDYVLGHFLRAVVQFVARYQPPEAAETAFEPVPGAPSEEELDAGAEADFLAVIEAAPKVKLDHYLLFHNHYELGRLYARRGDVAKAQANFDIVMHNRLPVANHHIGKGKYSLEGALQIKTHAAMQALKEQNGAATNLSRRSSVASHATSQHHHGHHHK